MKPEPLLPCGGCKAYFPASELGAKLSMTPQNVGGVVIMSSEHVEWVLPENWNCPQCKHSNNSIDHSQQLM